MKPEQELFEGIAKEPLKKPSIKKELDAEINRLKGLFAAATNQEWAMMVKMAMLVATGNGHDAFLITGEPRVQLTNHLRTMLTNYNNLDKPNKAESLIAGAFQEEQDTQF